MAKYTPISGNPFEGMVDDVPKPTVPPVQAQPKPEVTASTFTPTPKGFNPFEGQDPNRTPKEIADAKLKKSVDNLMGGQMFPLPVMFGEDTEAAFTRANARESERLVGTGRGINRIAQGAKQLYLDKFGDKQSLEEYNEYLRKENEVWAAMPESKTINAKIGQFMGSSAPFMVIPGVQGGFLLRTGYSAGLGGAMGYSELQDPREEAKDTRTEKLLKGIIFGAGASTVFDAVTRLPRYLNLRILKANTTDAAGDAYKEGTKIVDTLQQSTGQRLDFDLYQMTGRPSAAEAVRQYAKTTDGADRLFSQQLGNLEKLGKAWESTVTRATKTAPGVSPTKLVTDVKATYDKYMTGLKDLRNKSWDTTMGGANKAARTEEFIDLKATREALDDRLAVLRAGDEPELAGTIGRLESTLTSLQSNVSVDVLQGKLKLYRELADSPLSSGIEKIKVNTYVTIRDALKKEVDTAASIPTLGRPELTEAVSLLKRARDQWSKDSAYIDNINASSIGTMLGKDLRDMKVEDVATKLTKMSPREIGDITHIMNKVDPAMMDNIRGYTLREAWQAATKRVELSGMPNVDIKQFWENAPSKANIVAMFKGQSGVVKELDAALKASRKLSESIQGTSGNVVELMQNAAGVSASLSPTFMAILGAKFLGRNYFKQLATEEGRNAIIQMSKTTSPSKFIAAAAVLMDTAEDVLIIDDMRSKQQPPTPAMQQTQNALGAL